MSTVDSTLDPITIRETIEAMLAAKYPFGDIEDYIETLPLDDEQKSALWLLAYSEQSFENRRDVTDTILLRRD